MTRPAPSRIPDRAVQLDKQPAPDALGVWGPPTPSDTPGFWLQTAQWAELTRAATSPEEVALVAAVAPIVLAHMDHRRPIGLKGAARFNKEVGAILAGILRPYLQHRRPVSVQRGKSGGLWANSPLLGHGAFWTKAVAMQAAGLIYMKLGVKTGEGDGYGGQYGGVPTRLWPAQRLLEMCHDAGVSEATPWTITQEAEQRHIEVPDISLVRVRRFESNETIPDGDLPAAQLEDLRTSLRALNAACDTLVIRGCLRPAFRRSYRGSLALGGRLYAVGAGNFQTMSGADRALIRIGAEPTIELDIRSSFLTILLGLAGATTLPPQDDLYALPGLPREACKAWFTQSFATGKLATHWSRAASGEVRAIRPTVIRKAAIAAFPAALGGPLTDVVLPAALKASMAPERLAGAVGQHLANIEAEIIGTVVDHFVQTGRVALPVHDSIIVRQQDAEEARMVLREAFRMRVGLQPRIRG